MSDTFKYYQPGGDAAQSFLNSKLSKNKFHVSKPGGSAYDSQRVVTNQAEIDQFNADNPGGSTGRLSAEQIRDKFGFEYNEEHATQSPTNKKGDNNEKTGAIYNRETGEYIGTIKGYARNDEGYKTKDGDGYLRYDDGINKFEDSMTSYAKDNNLYNDDIARFNSIGDVTKLANMIHGEDKKAPEPEYEMKDFEYSPEVKLAKSRIHNYETGVMTGATSNNIFGGGAQNLASQYEIDLSAGIAGIGTENSGADVGSEATERFLSAKKADVKSQYNIQPK